MKIFGLSACLGIRPNLSHAVKPFVPRARRQTLTFVTLLLLLGACAHETIEPESTEQETTESDLPEIEARTYQFEVVRKSRSNRVILMRSLTHPGEGALPSDRRILVLKQNETAEPTLALRVLKVFPDQGIFAVKRVRTYSSNPPLLPGEAYLGVEKISDIFPETKPALTEQDQTDLNELEKTMGLNPPDPPAEETPAQEPAQSPEELPPPPPEEPLPSEEPADKAEEDDESLLGLSVDEFTPFERNRNAITAGIAFLQNGGNYFAGAGLRYGFMAFRNPFFRRNSVQDSVMIEGGFYSYRILNHVIENDSYTVIPLIWTLRYNLYFSESFGMFFYSGLTYNMASATSELPDPDTALQTASDLSGVVPAAGAGFIFGIGPNWEARFDAGMELVGLSLTLRF